MKIAIIQFPGSNCESESMRAVRAAGMEAEEFLWNRKPSDLALFDGYFIVGGFSYEDRSRAGVIASLDPIMKYLRAENEKGKPILGVCNGAQILVEAGFVPGCKDYHLGMALATNKRIKDGRILGTGFYNAWVTLRLNCDPEATAFTCTMPHGYLMRVPVANAEGRFVINDALQTSLRENQSLVFRYSTAHGENVDDFPTNPNGSVSNLAAVTNTAGNVLAIMPHPERSKEGLPLFQSMQQYISRRNEPVSHSHFSCPQTPQKILPYYSQKNHYQFLVESIITDNEAFTVESAMRSHGKNVKLHRFVLWECTTDSVRTLDPQSIVSSGELFNANKERLVDVRTYHQKTNSRSFLVRYRYDSHGESMRQTLALRHGIANLTSLSHGIVWIIEPDPGVPNSIFDEILEMQILHNPFSQDCFQYHLL